MTEVNNGVRMDSFMEGLHSVQRTFAIIDRYLIEGDPDLCKFRKGVTLRVKFKQPMPATFMTVTDNISEADITEIDAVAFEVEWPGPNISFTFYGRDEENDISFDVDVPLDQVDDMELLGTE